MHSTCVEEMLLNNGKQPFLGDSCQLDGSKLPGPNESSFKGHKNPEKGPNHPLPFTDGNQCLKAGNTVLLPSDDH